MKYKDTKRHRYSTKMLNLCESQLTHELSTQLISVKQAGKREKKVCFLFVSLSVASGKMDEKVQKLAKLEETKCNKILHI